MCVDEYIKGVFRRGLQNTLLCRMVSYIHTTTVCLSDLIVLKVRGGGDATAAAQTLAQAVGTAVATAYASASAKTTVQGGTLHSAVFLAIHMLCCTVRVPALPAGIVCPHICEKCIVYCRQRVWIGRCKCNCGSNRKGYCPGKSELPPLEVQCRCESDLAVL